MTNTSDIPGIPKTILSELRRPFLSADTEFKIQSLAKNGSALCVAYVDARHVQERLNSVCAEFNATWNNGFREIYEKDELKAVECTITIVQQLVTTYHADVGSLDNVNEKFHGLKALYSDAFKRAAVHHGVAVSLYGLPQMWLKPDMLNGRYITYDGEAHLRDIVIKYLKSEDTIKRFGVPRGI